MKKRMIPLALALVMLLALCISANAAEPRFQGVTPTLTFSGTTANCSVNIVDPGAEINATITLWNGSRVVDSWSGSGVSVLYVSGSCLVSEGVTYTLKVTGMVDGVPIQGIPVSGTC